MQLKYAHSFRTPTSEEMYFTFKHPDFTILPNTDLKPEIAHNKELALTLHGKLGHVTTSVFQSDYDDFLNLDYLGQKASKTLMKAISRLYSINCIRMSMSIKPKSQVSKLMLSSMLARFSHHYKG